MTADAADADLEEQRAAALRRAANALQTASSLVPELESLADEMVTTRSPELEKGRRANNIPSSSRSKRACARESTWAHQLGIVGLLRHLERQRRGLEEEIELLNSSGSDLARVKKAQSRLQGLCPEVDLIEQRWAILKRCRNLGRVSAMFHAWAEDEIRRRVSDNSLEGTEFAFLLKENKGVRYRTLMQKMQITVHVVDWGYEWIHIRGSTLSQLTREMTDSGWDWGEHRRGGVVDDEEWDETPLAKVAKRLCDAAKLNRKEYVIPRVRLVLPRVNREDDGDVAVYLEQLERIDPSVKLSIDDLSSEFLKAEPPDAGTAIRNLVGEYDPLANLTPTLNLDNTVLIDLISDITHQKLEPQDWHASSTRAMIIEENDVEGGCMARRLYSVLSGRTLVCTNEAAIHFHNVLKTVGTASERERGRLLIPWTPEDQAMESGERRARFQRLSIYPVPEDFQLPVTVLVDGVEWNKPGAISDAVAAGSLPAVAQALADGVENRWLYNKLSVYMQGWASGDVTVTSEKDRIKVIRRVIEANRTDMEEKGPKVFELGMTRNLLSKNAKPPGVCSPRASLN